MDDCRQEGAQWEDCYNLETEPQMKEEDGENEKGRKKFQMKDRKEEPAGEEERQERQTLVPEFHVSVCEKAFIHMGGRWKIDLSGCFGAELSRLAVWIEEGDGCVSEGENLE